MKLTQPLKITIGLATAWLLLYPALFFLFIFSNLFMVANDYTAEPPVALFAFIFPLHCLTIVISLGLMGFYLYHIITNDKVTDVIRAIFGMGNFVMPFITMPIYYFFFIWSDTIPQWALKPEHQSPTQTHDPYDDVRAYKEDEKDQ